MLDAGFFARYTSVNFPSISRSGKTPAKRISLASAVVMILLKDQDNNINFCRKDQVMLPLCELQEMSTW